MTASENSFLGIAKQTAKGTPNVTDASFDYLLFTEGAVGPQPIYLPLDMEVGGGALLRNTLKTGIMTGGQLAVIPRPKTLGHAFLGMTGAVNSVDNADLTFTHTFTLGADQFAAPWYTVRSAPGNLLGEQFADVRFAGLTLSWRAAQFIRGSYAFQGAAAPEIVSTAAWNALPKVDGGPQFIAPLGTIELPTATPAYVTAGSFTAVSQMPTDEQFVVGEYAPQNLSITQRAYALSLMVKIEDANLYKKVMYDPALGSSWLPTIFREANFKLEFESDVEADAGVPYKFTIAGNGDTGAAANVTWNCQPIAMRAGRQLILAVTGIFLADPDGSESPISLSLTNLTAAY